MSGFNARRMEQAVTDVIELAQHDWKAWDANFEGLPPGFRALTDAEYPDWFEAMVAEDEARQLAEEGIIGWVAPDGRVHQGAGWPLMLSYIEDGRHEIARYLRTRVGPQEGAR